MRREAYPSVGIKAVARSGSAGVTLATVAGGHPTQDELTEFRNGFFWGVPQHRPVMSNSWQQRRFPFYLPTISQIVARDTAPDTEGVVSTIILVLAALFFSAVPGTACRHGRRRTAIPLERYSKRQQPYQFGMAVAFFFTPAPLPAAKSGGGDLFYSARPCI